MMLEPLALASIAGETHLCLIKLVILIPGWPGAITFTGFTKYANRGPVPEVKELSCADLTQPLGPG